MKFINKKKGDHSTILLIGLFFIFLFLPVTVKAMNLSDAFTDMLSGFGSSAGYETSISGPESMISTVINIALSLIGVIFMILMIYGGYLWMTAAGAEEKVKKAQNTITAAVIGLVLIIASYAISSYVMTKLEQGTISDKVGEVPEE